jgi:translocation and assembly module TamA
LLAHGRPGAIGLDYDVAIASLGDPSIDAAVAGASMLVALRDEPVLPIALIARAEADRLRIDNVLRSFGYYDAVIDMKLNGMDLADPSMPEALAARVGKRMTLVSVRVDRGALYRLGEVGLDGAVPGAVAALDLRAGEPAAARRVLAAGAAMLDALREDGFALARVPPPQATVDHRTSTMDVRYLIEPGPRVSIGAIEVEGLERLSEAFVRRRLGLRLGDPYSPSRLEQARRDLAASDAVAAARVVPAATADTEGRLPLRIAVVEAKRRTIRIAGAYATDEGASLHLGWTHRNLFGRAERLSVRGEIGTLGSGSLDDLDYAAGVSLRLPDRWRRGLDLALDLGAVSESLNAYDRDALTLGGALERRLSRRAAMALGVAFERSRIAQDGQTSDFRLLSLPMMLDWDATDDALAPRQGVRVRTNLVPVPWVRGDADPFARVTLAAAGYLDLSHAGPANGPSDAGVVPGDTVIAGRIALGRIVGASANAVPPDWRFYAGGAGSVRGYPHQSIGPRTGSDQPAGGDSSLEASIELRRRVVGQWGIVAFADAGGVAADGLRNLHGPKIGVGLGIRFHTVIGPLRADLAVPLDPYPGDAPVQLYLGLGEAF